MFNTGDLQLLIFVVEIVYPKYNAYGFIIYMILNYCDILKQQQTFTLQSVSTTYLRQLIGSECIWDVHNTIVVNDKSNQNAIKYALAKIDSSGNIVRRKVHVVAKYFTSESLALTSSVLLHNFRDASSCTFRKCEEKTLKFADEIELSLINTSKEWTQFIVDTCLKNYFTNPKLLYKGDVVKVSLKEYGKESFFQSNKLNNINDSLHFKCNKVIYMGKSVDDGYLCAVEKSTLKQSTNVQSYIPKDYCKGDNSPSVSLFYPFKTHLENIRKTIRPFISKDSRHFHPIFLLVGYKGSGKSLLLQNVASSLGLHLYTVNSCDATANVYAQNETKLRNIFFTAKMVAPSILEIQNFENFGKNNEGEYDERLISHFKNEVKNLFVGNAFPLIVFCCSNEKNIPIDLKRIFLKNFEIGAPSEQERENILQWILTNNGIKTTLDVHNLANKSHGFIFEDLRALVDRAVSEFHRVAHGDLVPECYFFEALDFMQSIYNEGLGAPKVPQVKWSDVGGLNDVKEEIIKTIKLPLKHPHLLQASGLKRSGILLFGPPGTGKTLLAKAVATECGLCFLSVKGPELLNMYVGQSEKNVREVFERARDASPCIIFFDELDSLAPNRGAAGDSGGVMDRVVSQLLAEMDGLNRSGTVFIIGATNRPDLIDPALLRPGRFDKLLYVGPCVDRDSKLAVLKALTRKIHFDEKSTLEEIVDMCPQSFSGADFYGMCFSAWMLAVRRLITNIENGYTENSMTNQSVPTTESVIVTVDDFKIAMKHVKPSIRQEDLDYFYKLKSEIAW